MRRYKIFYKRLGMKSFTQLEPNVNAALYDKPEVRMAIEHMRMNSYVVGIVAHLDGELFNVVSFESTDEVAGPTDFEFQPFADAFTIKEPIDAKSVLEEAHGASESNQGKAGRDDAGQELTRGGLAEAAK